MLKVENWPVPPYLSRHLDRVVRVSGSCGPPVDHILPDVGAAGLAIHIGDTGQLIEEATSTTQPSRLMVGALSHAAGIRHGSSIDTVFVSLPAGCGCVLGVPAAVLRDVITSLDAVAPGLDAALRVWVDEFRAGLAGRQNLMDVLARSIRLRCDRVVREIAGRLGGASAPSVASLATEFGLSRRQVDRRFRATLGRTPREFRRIARFARAWRLAEAGRVESWATLAATAGYFDQSHLIHDFRVLVRETPKSVFRDTWYAAFESVPGPEHEEPAPAPLM
jgi:AraC-like DNA-binding protein